MPVKILHIIPDDKFLDKAMSLFDAVGYINVYVFISDKTGYEFRYIKSTSRVQVIRKENLRLYWQDVNMVAFHCLPSTIYDVLLSVPAEKKILWLSWGYDIYLSINGYDPIIPINLYKDKTSKYVNPRKPVKVQIRNFVKKVLLYKTTKQQMLENERQIKLRQEKQLSVLSRVDYISTVLPSEYESIKSKYKIHAEYFPFQYPEEFEYDFCISEGKNVLVGNSVTPTNNHLDVLDVLKKKKCEILLPVSYGDMAYLSFLENCLGGNDNIRFLKKYLSFEEYVKVLSSCSVAIFGCMRQQSVGNVNICISKGMKIFFYKDSVLYHFFSTNGYKVFSLENDLHQLEIPLSKDEAFENYTKMMEQFSFGSVARRMSEWREIHEKWNEEIV